MNMCSYFLDMHMSICSHTYKKTHTKTIRSARIDEIEQVPDYDVSHENGKSLNETAEVVIEHTEGMGKYLRKLQALVEQIMILPQSL